MTTWHELGRIVLDAWPLWCVILIATVAALRVIGRQPARCLCHLLTQRARARGAHCTTCHKKGVCRCRKIEN